ncbi:MAG: [FeFe] hydrogenase H-cluster radical SAM maturase HydE [Spirochaetes bacterium]|nr:[FeFe] hydrogenase H-cluster radical SAM maturase HydE [Spirochaetota bacterium]MBU0955778.1 [FeFe] hydrogenase H-cluster radical SAM maturase HydE [Spirochaetota bacterium]
MNRMDDAAMIMASGNSSPGENSAQPGIAELLGYKSREELHAAADRQCRETFGDAVFVRGLIEASNSCVRNCLYCGIRHANANISRYSMSDAEILTAVHGGFAAGLRSFVIQGAEDPLFYPQRLAGLAGSIKELTAGQAAITYSFGTMERAEYAVLKSAGVDRYLLRFETANAGLHQKLRGSTLSRRLQALGDLRSLDFEVGSGFMTGLPGSTLADELDNIELCRQLDLDMVGIGPFIPHPDTPLAADTCRGVQLAIDACAAVRLVLPAANLPATTAAGSLAADGRERMLAAGANVLMPNIGSIGYKKDYELYPGKICLDEDGLKCLGCLGLRVTSINKQLVLARGDSPAWTARKGVKQ